MRPPGPRFRTAPTASARPPTALQPLFVTDQLVTNCVNNRQPPLLTARQRPASGCLGFNHRIPLRPHTHLFISKRLLVLIQLYFAPSYARNAMCLFAPKTWLPPHFFLFPSITLPPISFYVQPKRSNGRVFLLPPPTPLRKHRLV